MDVHNADDVTVSCGTVERLAGLVLVAALAALALLPLRPPPEDTAAFPTADARALVAELARAPHPLGSAEHARVAGLIEDRIREAGLEPVRQQVLVSEPVAWGGVVRAANVRNVMTRLPGSGGGATVLLMAHYDTVQTSPGAADDSAGVAALLTTLAEMAAGPTPANDLIFLFTDAEEPGLFGARAFVQEHPWADEVDLVINFEARGSEGPSVMFETGPGTGALVADFASVALDPVAASYSYDVYRHLPNDTDFSVFRDAGVPGFNFAFIGGSRRYHSRLDTPEGLSGRSLAHHGAHARLLARHFAAADLSAGSWGAPRTYFNLPLLGLVVHPSFLSVAAAVLAFLLAGWLLLGQVRRGRLAWRGLGLGTAAVFGVLVLPALAALLVDLLVIDVAGLFTEHFGDPGWFLVGEIFLALGIAVLSWNLAVRWAGPAGMVGAALLVSTLLAVVAVFVVPSSAYLLAWPALGGALACAWLWRGGAAGGAGRCLLLLVPALPVLLLWPPALHLVSEAFGMGDGIILGLLTALAVVLAAPSLAPLAAGRPGHWSAVLVALAGLGLVVVTTLGAGYDEERPEETSLMFLQDAETGEAQWATLGLPVDSWARENLGDDAGEAEVYRFLGGNAIATVAPAPALEVEPPRVELTGVRQGPEGPVYQLRAVSPRGAPALRLELESESPLGRLRVDGEEVELGDAGDGGDGEGADVYLIHYTVPPEGLEVEAAMGGEAPLTVIVADQGYDLETLPGLVPRGEGRVPSRTVPTDLTIVRGESRVIDPATPLDAGEPVDAREPVDADEGDPEGDGAAEG